jgi:hypothetical protein
MAAMKNTARPKFRVALLTLVLAGVASMSLAGTVQAKVLTGGCLVGGADCLETAIPIEPDATVANPQVREWDSVSVAGDGQTLTIFFWMGPADCNGLHSVDVSQTDSGIDIGLSTGTPAGAEDLVCIQIAALYQTSVLLEQPLIGGGIFAPAE